MNRAATETLMKCRVLTIDIARRRNSVTVHSLVSVMKGLMLVPLGMLLAGCLNAMPNVYISDVGYGKVYVAYDYVPYENLDQPEGTAPHLPSDRFKVADGFWQLVMEKAEEGCALQGKSATGPLSEKCISEGLIFTESGLAVPYCEQYAQLFACTD